jgi:NADP-dependent aldehyde dehydrogenase
VRPEVGAAPQGATRNVLSIDPRTGESAPVSSETSERELDDVCRRAQSAAPALEDLGRAGRAVILRAMADGLEAARERVVRSADRETAIGEPRLNGELTRTCYQLRLFADTLDEGSYLEATIDHAANTPMGPRPDLRRMLVPIGPVAVFGASNFPLAFSVPGGDTASAIAAGCPVVVKAHESHPATSELCLEVLNKAVLAVGAPHGVLSLVHGRLAGAGLVAHPAIRAVGFTGSLAGGQALLGIINSREDPIPFYGELSSLNPVVVSPRAAEVRADEIGNGLVASITTSAGQLCTKPGLIFVPTGREGDALVEVMVSALASAESAVPLNERIHRTFVESVQQLKSSVGICALGSGRAPAGPREITPLLLLVDLERLADGAAGEHFGPLALVARYASVDQLESALLVLPSSLTASVHVEDDEPDLASTLTALLRRAAGRLVFNGYPTGVAVSWAQTHAGPWPSTNMLHTSVGPTAVRRFLRPITWQNAPSALLPPELREGVINLPRRVDGVLQVPASNES